MAAPQLAARRSLATQLTRFVLVGGVAGMNAVMLALLPPMRGEITAAFVVAQGTATCINFVVQRTVIFRR